MQCQRAAVKGPLLSSIGLMIFRFQEKKTTTTVKTINREAVAKIAAIEGLQLPNGLDKLTQKQRYKSLHKTDARRELTVESEVVKPDQIAKWKYLEGIKDQLNLNPNVKIGLPIGANCPKALEPERVIYSEGNGPNAFKIVLDWYMFSPIKDS